MGFLSFIMTAFLNIMSSINRTASIWSNEQASRAELLTFGQALPMWMEFYFLHIYIVIDGWSAGRDFTTKLSWQSK